MAFKLPGSHFGFYPWTPPSWLPQSTMEELEVKLILTLRHMLAMSEDEVSTLSSPASSYSGEEQLSVEDEDDDDEDMPVVA